MRIGLASIAIGLVAMAFGILIISSRNPNGTGLSVNQILFYVGAAIVLLGFVHIGWVSWRSAR